MSIEDPKEITKKPEQNDPSGELLKSIKEDLLTALVHKVSDYRPTVVIDCHMHLQSGNCATLPFLWKKTGPLRAVRPGRNTMISLGKVVLDFFPDLAHFFVSEPGEGGENATELQKDMYRRHKLRDTNEVAKNSTYEIGEIFAERMKTVLTFLKEEPLYKGVSQLSFSCVVLTMDMEYAHLDGYYGIKVCNAIYKKGDPEQPIDYWYPFHGGISRKDDRAGYSTYIERDKHVQSLVKRDKHPTDLIKRDKQLPSFLEDQTEDEFDKDKPLMDEFGIPGVYYKGDQENRVSVKARVKLLGKEETELYEPWKKQVANTELAVLANPLRLLPLFHYDPRRWQTQGNMGNAHPFAQVGKSGLYLGFKMYTAQGYRPWDPRLPILGDFYRQCCVGEIPIVNHCTPGGAPTFDLEKYRDFEHLRDDIADYDNRQKNACPDAGEYFRRHFVSPEAWRKVLEKEVKGRPLSDLRLCLAHFGGDDEEGREWGKQILDMMRKYPNVYADLSYSFATAGFRDYFEKTICKSPGFVDKIRHRILFGTDWYLTMLDGVDYKEFCVKAKKSLDSFDTSLWLRFTQANPYAFFRIDQQIRRIANNIVERRKKKKVIDAIGEPEAGIEETILKEAAWIEAANGPYRNYQQTL